MNKIPELSQPAEFDALLEEMKKPFFLLKHSTSCSISMEAYDNVESFMEQNPEFPVYCVLVKESRPLSDHIAEVFPIPHQSPQIFLIFNKRCLWHDSHSAITRSSLGRHLAKIRE